jgi:predicted nuclease with RNAse H fold
LKYIGIDVGCARFDVAVLDQERRIHALPAPFRHIEPLVQWVCEHARGSYVAVDAPQRTREGVLACETYRRSLTPPPPEGRYQTVRECDYELMRRGLPLYQVPAEYALCPAWMRAGFHLYDALLGTGRWTLFDGARHAPCLLEVYPFAAFAVMLGAFPPRKSTPAGREARLASLRKRLAPEARLEEATEHHTLDALAAACTAWSLDHGQATWVGNPREGLMVLPGPLADRYRRGG